jgi:hypothetical protein
MSNLEDRIAALESGLKPQQMLSLWLSELEGFESPSDYLEAMDDRETRAPTEQFLKQARRDLKHDPTVAADQKADDQICHTLRQLVFLQYLLWAANSEAAQLLTDCKSRLHVAATIAEMLDFARSQTKTSTAVPRHAAKGKAASVKNVEHFIEKGRRAIAEVLTALRAEELAMDSMSYQHFYGGKFLFRSSVREKEALRRSAESCAGRLNEFLSSRPTARRIDVKPNEKRARESREIMIKKLEDYAKALTRLLFGQKAEALALIRPHLKGFDSESQRSALSRGRC